MADSTRNDSVVKVLNVNVLDNPTCLTNPFQFEIVFESNRDLKEGKQFGGLVSIDLEWRHLCWRSQNHRWRPSPGFHSCGTCNKRNS